MAWRCNRTDARNNFGIPFILFQFIFQEWEHRLKSFGQAMLLFGELSEDALIHPKRELGARHVNRGVRKDRYVVRGLAHKPKDMVWVEMRNDHLRDLRRLDASRGHIGDHS